MKSLLFILSNALLLTAIALTVITNDYTGTFCLIALLIFLNFIKD